MTKALLFSLTAFISISSYFAQNTNLTALCPVFSCDEEKEESLTTCMTAVQSTNGNYLNYVFNECDSDYTCMFDPNFPYKAGDTAACKLNQDRVVVGKYYDERCDEDAQCLSNSCSGDKCDGIEEDQSCSHHGECGEKLFCNKGTSESGVCKEQFFDSVNSCSEDWVCSNDRVCFEGVCQIPYTLEDGERTTNPKMCKSGISRTKGVTGDLFEVCDSYALQGELQCADDQVDCSYKWGSDGSTMTKPCVCAMTAFQVRRCPADLRDEFLSDSSFNFITIDKANTLLRSITNWKGKVYNKEWPHKDMPECVADIINSSVYYYLSFINLVFVTFLLL